MPLLLVVMPLLLVASYKCTSVYIDIPYLTSHPCNSFENLICGPDIVAIADRLNLPMSWCITCINKYIYIYISIYWHIYIIYILYILELYIYIKAHTHNHARKFAVFIAILIGCYICLSTQVAAGRNGEAKGAALRTKECFEFLENGQTQCYR